MIHPSIMGKYVMIIQHRTRSGKTTIHAKTVMNISVQLKRQKSRKLHSNDKNHCLHFLLSDDSVTQVTTSTKQEASSNHMHVTRAQPLNQSSNELKLSQQGHSLLSQTKSF
jgi:hypothetical protein